MTWPTSDVDTTALDAGTDTPPRSVFLAWAQAFNQLISHVSAFWRGVLDKTTASDAQTALGATATGKALFTAANEAAVRTAAGATATGSSLMTAASGAAAFTAIKQAASETATGVVELATTTEAAAGTDTSRSVTPAGAEAHMNANALGWGQTWQNVLASRATGVTYTNSTGRPILVQIVARNTSAGDLSANLTVNGVVVSKTAIRTSFAFQEATLSAIVPNSSTYVMSAVTSGSVNAWAELR
jgi:hypothetical protein